MTSRTNSPAGLNKEVALARVGGDLELLQELAQLFLDDYPKVMGELKKAIVSRDPELVERAAHTLKGSVSNFGADHVFDAALRLETLGRNEDLATVEPAFAQLETTLAALRPELIELATSTPHA